MAFLETLSTAAQVGGDIASLAKLFGLGKDRPSWRDMQFMMDTSERLAPRDIALQGQYLEGLAPHQAAAYNEYQGATYGEDTQRQIDRIKSTGEQLGMSPWEIMGQGGAAPLPAPAYGGGGQAPQKGDYLQSIPVKIAEMNNKTALAQTAMQTATQERIASQQTAGGELPKKQVLESAARTILAEQDTMTSKARERESLISGSATQNRQWLESIGTLAQWAGTTEINVGGVIKQNANNEYPALVKMYQSLVNDDKPTSEQDAINAYVSRLPADQFQRLERDAKRAARAVLSLAADTGKGFLDGIGKFFSGQ